MLISIIIPIYNVENYIKKCLESVYQQTYSNIEVILVNDCTPDHSMEIARSIVNKNKNKYSTIIINHEINKGLSEARNNGMKIAKGEYIYFMDSDDIIIPETISLLANIAIKHKGIEMVEGNYVYGTTLNKQTHENILIFRGKESQEQCLRKPTVWNILYLRTFLLKHSFSFYPNIYHEDLVFRYDLSKKISFYGKLSSITYLYRQTPNSIMHTKSPKHIASIIEILKYIHNDTYDTIQGTYHKLFCSLSLNYWKKQLRGVPEHRLWFNTYKEIVNVYYTRNYKSLQFVQLLQLSPALFPYFIAKYYVKLIWKLTT